VAGIAVAGVLSAFIPQTLAVDPALPLGRFGGLAWVIAAGVTLTNA
jgi:hypothetical protein